MLPVALNPVLGLGNDDQTAWVGVGQSGLLICGEAIDQAVARHASHLLDPMPRSAGPRTTASFI